MCQHSADFGMVGCWLYTGGEICAEFHFVCQLSSDGYQMGLPVLTLLWWRDLCYLFSEGWVCANFPQVVGCLLPFLWW